MNRSFIVAVLTVTMIIMMSTAGYAVTAPHNFYCDNCHGKFDKFSAPAERFVAAGNSCITCHNSMGQAPRMPVDVGAMANYFGSVPQQPVTGSRSTHTYMVSYSGANPVVNYKSSRSNTAAPITAALVNVTEHNSLVQIGQVTCNRCHNAPTTTAYSKSLLRTPNVGDALCFDCHRNRIATDTKTGSHPVNYRAYSSVYKLNTTAFRKTPLSPNSYNNTAKLGNYLSSGKIVCSTCHSVHYGDSNSATLDNRSTANGFAQDDLAKGLKGQLQDSRGQLLRTDPIGATAASINVCSSCHKETKNLNHNKKGQNVQCDHCHGAHVDYTGDGSAPNLLLVRRDFSNMSISTGKLAAGKKAIYNTETSLRFKRADGNGICQVCHVPTPGVSIHDNANTRRDDCIACHKHSDGFSAADCTTCHGQPPVQGKAATGYTTLDEAFTPHMTHADKAYYNYACKNCHYDGTRGDSHNTKASTGTATYQSVFVETAGSISEPFRKNISSDYNPTSRRCSGVYCHSNGSPRSLTMAWKSYSTPSWEYGRNKILGKASECTTCHESGPTLDTNSHAKHVTTNSYKCNVCHAATVNDAGAITDRSKHANGIKDVSFITRPSNYVSVFTAQPFNTTDATCVNSCHTNGFGVSPVTPAKWTDKPTGACGTCHDAVPTTNLHTYHFSNSVGPQLGTTSVICANCHSYSPGALTHANGVVNLKSASPCQPCHPGTTPTFTVGSAVTCESCHTGGTASVVSNLLGNYTAPLKSLNATVGHGQYPIASSCTNCHNASAPHIGAAPTEKRLITSGNALCNTCHISAVMGLASTARANLPVHGGTVNKFTFYTSALNLTNIATLRSDACSGCHDTHGTTNIMSIRTVINGQTVTLTNTSSGFIAKTKTNGKYNGFCQVCHSTAKHFNNFTTPELGHQGSGGKNCLTCHKHKGGTFAFLPVGGGCNGCHGYPPAGNMTGIGIMNNYTNAKPETTVGAGGAHTVAGHIAKTAKQDQAWANCATCHFNQTSTHNQGGTPVKSGFVNVVVDPAYKFNNTSTIKYNARTCSNVSCHFKKSPNW